jgi:hypothetical protein
MADQSLSIRLALTDGGKVKAELVDIGASGQTALAIGPRAGRRSAADAGANPLSGAAMSPEQTRRCSPSTG